MLENRLARSGALSIDKKIAPIQQKKKIIRSGDEYQNEEDWWILLNLFISFISFHFILFIQFVFHLNWRKLRFEKWFNSTGYFFNLLVLFTFLDRSQKSIECGEIYFFFIKSFVFFLCNLLSIRCNKWSFLVSNFWFQCSVWADEIPTNFFRVFFSIFYICLSISKISNLSQSCKHAEMIEFVYLCVDFPRWRAFCGPSTHSVCLSVSAFSIQFPNK